MDRSEQKLREQLARAKGGHKRRFEARLAQIEASRVVEAPVVEVKAPAKKKKETKKKSE
tara:strand:- start:120 stop:296 length:177 start_codon:yes stop_codon:yes gene_type:complete